ncbi:MAG: acyl-CoA thioesterase [SAR324 cluster bacterium]|nr:acyl-CoA thioesterase [SAR324 cluster bacterium]
MKQPDNIKVTLDSDLMDHLSESFAIDFQVTNNEIDNLGYLSNVHCLNWINTVHQAHLLHLGITPMAMRQSKIGFVTARLILECKHPVKSDDFLRFGTELLAGDDESSMRRKFQIVRVENPVTVAIAVIDYSCVKIENLKPTQIPTGLVGFFDQAGTETENPANKKASGSEQ